MRKRSLGSIYRRLKEWHCNDKKLLTCGKTCEEIHIKETINDIAPGRLV
ncbi:hypothetical protein [Holospora curviuscula]|nr:hypothetical protein [Holospora curviuscula]